MKERERTEHEVFVVGRRRGRPRAEEQSSTVSVWMFARHHDRLIQIARERRVSVSAVARQMIMRSLKGER